MHLAQCLGRCIHRLNGGTLRGGLLGFPTLTPFGLSAAPGIHRLFVLILLALLVVDGEAALLRRIERRRSRAGRIGLLVHPSQVLLGGFKPTEECRQLLLVALAQRQQPLLLGQAFPLFGRGRVGGAARQQHHSQQGQQPETADHTNPWARSTLTGNPER